MTIEPTKSQKKAIQTAFEGSIRMGWEFSYRETDFATIEVKCFNDNGRKATAEVSKRGKLSFKYAENKYGKELDFAETVGA